MDPNLVSPFTLEEGLIEFCEEQIDVPMQYIHMNNEPHALLPEALIPPPVVGVEEVADIYIKDDTSPERWRSYLEATQWNPKGYHDHQIAKRAYHSRMYWECCILISFTDGGWLSLQHLQMIRDISHLNLRSVEIEIMHHQLTTGMIGLRMERKLQNERWEASIALYTTALWLTKKTGQEKKVLYKWEQNRPFRSDTKFETCKKIDGYVAVINELLSKEQVALESKKDEGFVKECGRRCRHCILSFDKIAYVTV